MSFNLFLLFFYFQLIYNLSCNLKICLCLGQTADFKNSRILLTLCAPSLAEYLMLFFSLKKNGFWGVMTSFWGSLGISKIFGFFWNLAHEMLQLCLSNNWIAHVVYVLNGVMVFFNFFTILALSGQYTFFRLLTFFVFFWIHRTIQICRSTLWTVSNKSWPSKANQCYLSWYLSSPHRPSTPKRWLSCRQWLVKRSSSIWRRSCQLWYKRWMWQKREAKQWVDYFRFFI